MGEKSNIQSLQTGEKIAVTSPSEKIVTGAEVLQEVVQMTGLPQDYLDAEISGLLGTGGESVNNLTLDQLRSVLMNYLETINEEITQSQNKH